MVVNMADTILDYIKTYGEYTFAERPMTDVDSLVFCQFCYLKFDGMVPLVTENRRFVNMKKAVIYTVAINLLQIAGSIIVAVMSLITGGHAFIGLPEQVLLCTMTLLVSWGAVLDIRDTQVVAYTMTNICSVEWVIADGSNCPQLGGENTFSFGEAIKYLKRGMKVARKGWNGKNQHIELASGISYTDAGGIVVNVGHEAIGNKAIAFVGTSGVQMGWLASQADMLAEDWVFAQ